ncbi:MAPEG family protein [Sphingomonas sp. NFR15]|uniref:MAPEG family protein n=1 Tax=Sphingomonas sp. NFR15 TaxID=1566282 RepID=UPI00088BD0D6|nr:MAPEG family protein [Sphingomonas sp. NFR15]SDA35398.1 MAPEG family protein [Sphingomonas sp. NFR15]
MLPLNNFQREQRGVAIRMVAALCITVVVVAACLELTDPTPLPLADRLIVVARADLLVLVWLAATIGNVARLRFFSANDIAGSASTIGTDRVSRANAVLQNTLEQVVLAVPIHVALAVLVQSSSALIIALALLFAIGRFLFWIGYANGARSRAFGFALTFYPSVAGLVIAMTTAARLSL